MKRGDIEICILRVGGTNCDVETKRALTELGVRASVIHANELARKCSLLDYDALVFPGGFSYGDYVRAGAIWAKWITSKLGKDLKTFNEEGRPILGICNGFQVLVEAGLLPAFEGVSEFPEAALAPNVPSGYNCRWISVKHENRGKCLLTSGIPKAAVSNLPVAHSEGRFMFEKRKEEKYLKRLYDNDQLVFRYCAVDGDYPEGSFPENPNGSFHDIAGICNAYGNIFALMPHPERAFFWWQQPEWTKQAKTNKYGDGQAIFESLVNHVEKKG